MALFSPDVVTYDDPPAFGRWLNGHYLEHRQFVAIAMAGAPPRAVADYDLIAWADDKTVRRFWLDAHQRVHDQLRHITGVQGFDLSVVDFDSQSSFAIWLDAHAQEHVLLRRAFGVI